MPFTYILECRDKTLYVGSTQSLEKRIWEHEQGLGANYTKKRRPVKLVYSEEYERIDEAFDREKQLQGWSAKKKWALIEREFGRLSELAISQKSPATPRPSTPLGNRPSTPLGELNFLSSPSTS